MTARRRPEQPLGSAVHRRLGDLLGIAWLVLLVFLFLSPALKDGPSFGPSDLGRSLSYLTGLGTSVPPAHDNVNGDIIDQSVAWNTLDWRLVHHGELPLWNDLSGNGMPQLLNFESAPLALPTLVGYLFPLSLAFLVTVAMKLLIAGTGVYVLARLLGCRPVAAALAGTSFMLSGSFAGWLGWSVSGPLAWLGWIAAASFLVYRTRRLAAVLLLALSVAFAVYGGFPETYALAAIGLGVLLAVTAAATLVVRRRLDLSGVARWCTGVLAGALLSSPLWMPGLSVIRQSVRSGNLASTGLPLHEILLLFAQGYDGLPLTTAGAASSTWFGQVDYFETATYVGVVALALAGAAVLLAWRRPAVIGLTATVAASLLVVYDLGNGRPVQRLLTSLGMSGVALQRMLPVLGFAVAVLAGLGLELLIRRWRETPAQLALGAVLVVLAAVLAAMWDKSGSVGLIPQSRGPTTLPSISAVPVRRRSLYWPSAELVVMLAAVIALGVASRARRVAVGAPTEDAACQAVGPVAMSPRLVAAASLAVLVAQSAFLLFAGVGINSYGRASYPETAAVSQLQHVVGNSLVAMDGTNTSCAASPPGALCGVRGWQGNGFYPEINLGYGIAELGVHDPLTPLTYFTSWPVPNADQVSDGGTNLFVPSVNSVALARRYGVRYVIVQPGLTVPVGMRRVATLVGPTGDRIALAAVPGASRFSFGGRAAGARVVSAVHPGDASYVITAEVPSGPDRRLMLRITDVPGWHATLNGHSAPLRRADGALLSVELPPGRSRVALVYRPSLMTLGFFLAAVTLVAFVALGAALAVAGRRRSPRPEPDRW